MGLCGLRKGRKRYKGSMPKVLGVIVKEALDFNRNNHRGFEKQLSNLVCCYALNGSKLLAFGYNKLKTHPFCKQHCDHFHNSIHAEMDALMQLNKTNNIDYVTDLVVIRGTANICDSRPCDICYGIIKMYLKGVRLWYYFDGEWKVEII